MMMMAENIKAEMYMLMDCIIYVLNDSRTLFIGNINAVPAHAAVIGIPQRCRFSVTSVFPRKIVWEPTSTLPAALQGPFR